MPFQLTVTSVDFLPSQLAKKDITSEVFFCYDATKIHTCHSIFREGKIIFPVD